MEEDVAVVRIKEQNFRALSCIQIADRQGDKLTFIKYGMEDLLKPLIKENNTNAFIKTVEQQTKDFLLTNLKDPEEIILLCGIKNEKGEEYNVDFHKVPHLVFAFLLKPISSAELRELERNATGKTYLTGDINDPIKTEKDFIQ